MALPSIEQVSQTINGVTVPCAHITCTEAANFRMENVLDTINSGSFTFQSVMRSNANRNIVIAVGNKEATYELTNAWAKFVTLYEDVDPQTGGRDMNIFFPAGEYWLYHTMLEHGNKVSDWKVSPEDTEEQIAQVYVEIREQYTQVMSDTERILLEALSSYTKVSDFETFKTENTAAIQLMAEEITSTVAATYQTKDDASTMQTQISQNATALAGKVSIDNYTAAQIALMINQAGEGEAIISAPHIQLDGNVVLKGDLTTAGGVSISGNNLDVGTISSGTGDNVNSWDLVNGQLKTKYGEIGGFTIANGAIYSGMTSFDDEINNGVYVGPGGIALGQGNFKVDSSGNLTANTATIKGILTANANSKIGPWWVTSDAISKSANGESAGRWNTEGEMYFGSTGLSIGKNFVVDADGGATLNGTVTATGGKIGPWFIATDSISKNADGSGVGSFYTKNNMYFGDSGLSLSDAFNVDSDGKLTATGVDISGDVKITKGNVNILSSDNTSEGAVNYINLKYGWTAFDVGYSKETITSSSGFTAKQVQSRTYGTVTDNYETTHTSVGLTAQYKLIATLNPSLNEQKTATYGYNGIAITKGVSSKKNVFSANTDNGRITFGNGDATSTGDAYFLDKAVFDDADKVIIEGSALGSYIDDRITKANGSTQYNRPSGISEWLVKYRRYGHLVTVSINYTASGALNKDNGNSTTGLVPSAISVGTATGSGNWYGATCTNSSGNNGYFYIDTSGRVCCRAPAAGTYYGSVTYPAA